MGKHIIKTKDVAPEVLIEIKDENLWTTSLKIAEEFHKEHRNVLQSIEKLECSQGFRLLNFQQSSYLDEQKKRCLCIV